MRIILMSSTMMSSIISEMLFFYESGQKNFLEKMITYGADLPKGDAKKSSRKKVDSIEPIQFSVGDDNDTLSKRARRHSRRRGDVFLTSLFVALPASVGVQ